MSIALPAFADNYIWLLPCSAGVVVVDPGAADGVLAYLRASNLQLHAILLTHHHHDHVGGTPELLAAFPQARVIGPRDRRIATITEAVGEGDEVQLGDDLTLRVLEVPGHTLTHIAFYSDTELYCGDTLFSLGCGRLFEGSPAQMLASLSRFAALDPKTRVYCGHEYTLANGRFASVVEPQNQALPAYLGTVRARRASDQPSLPSVLADELDCNPFLRVDAPALIEAVSARAGRTLADRVEVFAQLRAWKDGFA